MEDPSKPATFSNQLIALQINPGIDGPQGSSSLKRGTHKTSQDAQMILHPKLTSSRVAKLSKP